MEVTSSHHVADFTVRCLNWNEQDEKEGCYPHLSTICDIIPNSIVNVPKIHEIKDDNLMITQYYSIASSRSLFLYIPGSLND